MARYCFDEAEDSLLEYGCDDSEKEAPRHYKGLLQGTEAICAKDGRTFGTIQIAPNQLFFDW